MSDEIISLTEDNFEETIEKADKPVVIDFWAEWCGPCKMFASTFEELAEEEGNNFVFGKVNVDEQPEIAQEYNVKGIPTVVILKDGEVKNQVTGNKQKSEIKSYLNIHE